MKNIIYTNSNTFEEEEKSFEEFHLDLINEMKEHLECFSEEGNTTPIMVDSDNPTKLIFGFIKNRISSEDKSKKYRITVEEVIED